jgi:parvulin-like peptidyl-prolyl isomerase
VPVRLIVYSLGIVYLFLDLFVFDGPLRQKMRERNPRNPEQVAAAKAQGVVARVHYQPILLTQVDRRVEEALWKEGRTLEGLGKEEKLLRRKAALNNLIDLHLLSRIKTQFNAKDYPVSAAEVDAALEVFLRGFETKAEMTEGLRQMGWTTEELRLRLEAKIQQQKYLDALVDVGVTDEEARAWFEEHKAELGQPDRIRVRHIFLAALENKEEDAKKTLEAARKKLVAGTAEFGELAGTLSEDARSKKTRGELGWVAAGRLPDDFAEAVFALPVRKPAVVETTLGWHLVEVLEKKAGAPRSFEDAKPEIVAALEAIQREEALAAYRLQLRNFEAEHVEIFEDVLAR